MRIRDLLNKFPMPIGKEMPKFPNEIQKHITKYKKQKKSSLKALYLNIKLQLDSKKLTLDDETINLLTALEFLISEKEAKSDRIRIIGIAIITPIASLLITLVFNLILKK